MKKVTVDLRTAGYFGPSCKCLEMFEDLNYRGYRINLIAKNWTTDPQDSFRYDPKIHPNDFYENLVIPTFENINYIKTDKMSAVTHCN